MPRIAIFAAARAIVLQATAMALYLIDLGTSGSPAAQQIQIAQMANN